MEENNLHSQEASDAHSTDDMIMTEDEIRAIIVGYEQQYGMSSEEFLRQWKADTASDTWETNSWAMFLDWI